MWKFLLSVPCLMMLGACSKTVSLPPMPQPPANLRGPCPPLPMPPAVLLDPRRVEWETEVAHRYAVCASKHWFLSEAWAEAVKSSKR